MLWLWKRMLANFGSQWTREYGEADGDTAEIWCEALGGLTGEQLARGVKSCRDWGEKFPPNLAQFSKLCLTTNENTKEVQKYLEAPSKRSKMPPEVAEVWALLMEQPQTRDEAFLYAWDHLAAEASLNQRFGPLSKEQRERYRSAK